MSKLNWSKLKEWRENVLVTKSGLFVAPEDLVIVRGFPSREKSFFTFDEAMEINETMLKPAGWHIPTVDEWITLANEFRSPERLLRILGLNMTGFVTTENMKSYDGLFGGKTKVEKDGRAGYYWSSTEDSNGVAYFMNFTYSFVDPELGGIAHRNHGHAIRCIAS